MIHNPICSFEAVYDILSGSTEIAIFRLNDGQLLYKGSVNGSIKGLTTDYKNLVVPYGGIYNNKSTGNLDIEVWDLSKLEDLHL